MRMLRNELDSGAAGTTLTLWFDAWKYARSEQSLWRALLLAVVEALGDEERGLARLIRESPVSEEEFRLRVAESPEITRDDIRRERLNRLRQELEELRTSLYRSQTLTEKGDLRVNWGAALPFGADLALRFATLGLADKLGLSDFLGRLSGQDAKDAMQILEREQITRYREQVRSVEQFQGTLTRLIEREVEGRETTLFVFIDDLDRCVPDGAVSVLEAVKLFLDLPSCVFVLGMDREVVERGILQRYPPIPDPENPGGKPNTLVDPRQYLDKIIQLPFTLPPLTQPQVVRYLDDLFARVEAYPLIRACRKLIEVATPPNPRTLKRVLNVLGLLVILDSGRKIGPDDPELKERTPRAQRLAKIVLMQVLFDEAYRMVAEDPENLIKLEQAAQDKGDHDMKKLVEDKPRLKAMLQQAPPSAGLDKKELATLVSLTELTAGSSVAIGAIQWNATFKAGS
jgi:hypothetical protein